MADAAAVMLVRPATAGTGECYLDEEVLLAAGVDDQSGYAYDSTNGGDLEPDLFV